MYERGVRQAFDKPVALIKDNRTDRVFDIGMLSDVEYASDLRIDNVELAIDAIALRLQNTYTKKDEQVNSLIQLIKIQPAATPQPTVVSPDTSVLLDAIATLGRLLSANEIPRNATVRILSNTDAKFTKYCWMKFDENTDKIQKYINTFAETFPCDFSITFNGDSSAEVECKFDSPVMISMEIMETVAEKVGASPSRFMPRSREQALARIALMKGVSA